MSTSTQITKIQKKFPNVDVNVINYIFNTIAGGNVGLTIETISSLPKDQLDMLTEQFNVHALNPEQKETVKMFQAISGTK